MNKKYIYLGVIALLAVFSVSIYAFGYDGPAPKVVVEGDYLEASESTFGAITGPDVYFETFFHSRPHFGGNVTDASSTLWINDTLTAKEVCGSSIIHVNQDATTTDFMSAGLTVTLPTMAALSAECLTENGMSTSFWFANMSDTAASTTVLTAGTGMDLLECDDSSDCNVVIGGGGRALVEIRRFDNMEAYPYGSGTDLDGFATVIEFTAAD